MDKRIERIYNIMMIIFIAVFIIYLVWEMIIKPWQAERKEAEQTKELSRANDLREQEIETLRNIEAEAKQRELEAKGKSGRTIDLTPQKPALEPAPSKVKAPKKKVEPKA